MGALFLYDETITSANSKGDDTKCQVEVVDNHGIPEVRIGPEGEAYKGWTARFEDWKQFKEFMEAVNDLYERLKGIY